MASSFLALLLKTEDLLSKHFADEWQEDLQSTLANKDEVSRFVCFVHSYSYPPSPQWSETLGTGLHPSHQ